MKWGTQQQQQQQKARQQPSPLKIVTSSKPTRAANLMSQTLSRSDTTCWWGSARISALATQSATSLLGTQCQTMLRWEVTTATAGCSATATLGRSVKRVSRALLEKPMWTIAYENSYL